MLNNSRNHSATNGSASPVQRHALREKILHMYDLVFSEDSADLSGHFWEEFFILKPKIGYLSEIIRSSMDHPGRHFVYMKLATNGVQTICDCRQECRTSIMAAFNSLLTLSVVQQQLGKKFGAMNACLLLFPQSSDLKALIENLQRIICDLDDDQLVRECLRFLVRLVTASESLADNPFVPQLMECSFFDAFMSLVADPVKRSSVGFEVVTLLGILPYFQCSDNLVNPYMQLSVLDPSVQMMGIAAVIGESFRTASKSFFQKVIALQRDSSWTSWIRKPLTKLEPPSFDTDHRDSMLLALCTGIQIARNFVHAFTHAQSEILINPPPPSPSPMEKDIPANELSVVTPKNDTTTEPSNLFVEFVQYASIVLQFTRDPKAYAHARMSLVILCTITEDHYMTQSLHDFTINYRVHFYRAASRYHPCQIMCSSKPEPLACAILNLVTEFIASHMMPKSFPSELYFRCLLIIYRLMDYQKRARFRLPYQWKTLWSSLLILLKFVENNESALMEQMDEQSGNYFLLCTQVVNVLNIFLIGGDAILSQVGSYDDLCYEIVRNSTVVNSVYAMGLRYSTSQNQNHQSASKKLLAALTNLRSVVLHFGGHIETFSVEMHKVTMEREEILEVIRKNYDSLSLKLVDMTECFERNSVVAKDKGVIAQFLSGVLLDLQIVYEVTENAELYSMKVE